MTLHTVILTNILTGLVAVTPSIEHCYRAREREMVTLGEAPEAVQHTLRRAPRDCQITQVKMKTEKEVTILYEAHGIMTDGKKLTIQVAGDGKFINVENDHDDHRAQEKE